MNNLFNSTTLIGRIVDEELKTHLVSDTSNIVVCYFKIAINKGFVDKQTKQWVDKTQFIPIKAFGTKASYIAKNFNKGDLVILNCEIDVANKQDENGEWKTYWSLIIQNIKKIVKSLKSAEFSQTETMALKSMDTSQSFDVELAKEDEDKNPWELDL